MSTLRRAIALCAVLSMLATACGDDDDQPATSGDPSSDTSEPTDDDGEGEDLPAELTVTLADGALELSAEEIAGGAVEVTFENESDEYTELDITNVEAGTDEETFAEEFSPVLGGGPFPDFVINNAGVGADGGDTGSSTIELEPGDYIVWAVPEGPPEDEGEAPSGEGPAGEAPEGEDTEGEDTEGEDGEDTEGEAPEGDGPEGEGGGPPPEAFITAVLTVVDSDAGGAFPDTEGTITATDYDFEANVAGAGTYTFTNQGPEQFHHAIVVDFGTNDAGTVEEKLPELLEGGEGAPPPEGIDAEQIDFEFASTGVFGPNGKGTFEADFEEGNTYAVVCFIQDRSGGPPHAIAYDMYEVFEAG